MILGLAVRNLWRNTRRTLLTVAGIALATCLMLISMAMENGAWNQMIKAAIQAGAGHVVVQAEGWQEERDVEQWLDDSTGIAAGLAAAYPDAVVTRRVFLTGLLTSPTGSAAVTVQGVQPDLEAPLTLLDDQMAEGTWLDDDDRGVLLGTTLAETLGVSLGDKVVLMAQAGTDDMESRLFRVKGLFRTGNELLDAFGAFARIEATQALMGGADPAHQVAVTVPSVGKADLPAGPAQAVLAGREGAEVLTWRQALPLLEEQQELDASFSRILYGFMGLIVAVGVLNTVLMGVMERLREFGVMLAVGMKPVRLAGMIVVEGGLVGILGGVCGVALSAGPIWALQTWGIDYGDMMAGNSPVGAVPIDTVMRAAPDASQFVGMVVLATTMSLVASVLPARRALGLRPVDAIHHL